MASETARDTGDTSVSARPNSQGGDEAPFPDLPSGREIHLPGRGTTFIRELPGPGPDAPVAFLLHGWTATADLNFFAIYHHLAQHMRVVAIDHRGHGRGLRSRRPFRLADCADDVACLAAELGIERFVPVGYSMGGPIALLTWRRHAAAVCGLVLCATADRFVDTPGERMPFLGLGGLGALSRLAPASTRQWVTQQTFLRRRADRWGAWALNEAAKHDWRMVLEAGGALGTFRASDWLHEIDVPTSVVITTRDPVVAPERQYRLAAAISQVQVHTLEAEHDAAVTRAPDLAAAIVSGVRRAHAHRVAPGS